MIAIVSSIEVLLYQSIACAMRIMSLTARVRRVPGCEGCNMNATPEAAARMRWTVSCLVFLSILLWAGAAFAQSDSEAAAHRSESSRTTRTVAFLGGAAAGLLAHEGGHLLFDVIFDADPGLHRVEFAGIPFFAITHREGLSPRRAYTISAAGFWMQNAAAEWVLVRRPHLRRESAPFSKGVLAWSIASSAAYTASAMGRFGPAERDTRGMAAALGVPEPVVGTLVLIPAVFDLWRYLDPDARWPRWVSRAAKIGLVVLVVRPGS
jgi:hypothetical protein